jgi:cytochrome c oxidase cbb3-type subunit 3
LRIGRAALAAAVILTFGVAAHLAAQPQGGAEAPPTPESQTAQPAPAASATAAPTSAPAKPAPPAPPVMQTPYGPDRGRGANFPQQTRELASPDVIARGKAVYNVNCASCHAPDLRGANNTGANLIRSQIAMSDQHGELIAPVVHGSMADQGMPAINLSDSDEVAVAEYIHSVLYDIGSQGRPPNAPTGADLTVVVGDPVAGKTYFDSNCASCHSVTGDLAGIGAKYTDGRALQNNWVAGGSGFGRGRGARPRTTVKVAFTNGQTVEGNLLYKDDFLVTLIETDGTRLTVSRNAEVKSVDVNDPRDAHKKMAMHLNDTDMHNVTAYLATVK